MIYSNNYYFAGTEAILYKIALDDIGYTNINGNYSLPADTKITEIGFQYKKSSDAVWTSVQTIGSTNIPTINNDVNVEETDYIYSYSKPYSVKRVLPVSVVIKNLEPSTSYDIRTYYIEDDATIYINRCDNVMTMAHGDITYRCTEVTGGTEAQSAALMETLTEACDIYNAMTAFTKANSNSDYLGSKTGGDFTAKIGEPAGYADSTMTFRPGCPLWACIHEMAHNIMYPFTNTDDAGKIVKFMEFATHAENATWRWQSSHNYPVISPAQYGKLTSYYVAAGVYVQRDAGNVV